jgi:hypothetical protein
MFAFDYFCTFIWNWINKVNTKHLGWNLSKKSKMT